MNGILEYSLLIFFFLAWWWIFAGKLIFRIPVLPPLKPAGLAKWNGPETLLFFAMFCFLPAFAFQILQVSPGVKTFFTETEITVSGENAPENENSVTVEKPKKESHHLLVQFLAKNPSPAKFLFGVLFAVIWMPFVEEFLFRAVIQGWAESAERKIFGISRKNGWRAVIFVALFFSLMHLHAAEETYPPNSVLWMQFIGMFIGTVLTVVLTIYFLRRVYKTSWRKMGLDLRYWKSDLWYGFLAFNAVAVPVLVIQNYLYKICTERGFSADQFSLIPIALVFGLLYWRTHRVLPGFTAHALLNGTTVLGIFLGMK